MLKGLFILIRERFPIAQYGPMIVVFALANSLYATNEDTFSRNGLLVSILILISSFLRLRFFDEIKDYETDLKINPHRPLARGVISRDQLKVAILSLIVLEVALSLYLGFTVLLIHALAIGYSLLMFEEFFVGPFLRPHLTTYAVTHTFSSVLFAATVSTGSILEPRIILTSQDIFFLLSHWMFFNIFEFARKTYAANEERTGVDTYSSLFGIAGAVGLSFSQVILGLILLHFSVAHSLIPIFVLAAVYLVIGSIFILKKNQFWARIFRHSSGAYLLLHYALLAWILGRGHS